MRSDEMIDPNPVVVACRKTTTNIKEEHSLPLPPQDTNNWNKRFSATFRARNFCAVAATPVMNLYLSLSLSLGSSLVCFVCTGRLFLKESSLTACSTSPSKRGATDSPHPPPPFLPLFFLPFLVDLLNPTKKKKEKKKLKTNTPEKIGYDTTLVRPQNPKLLKVCCGCGEALDPSSPSFSASISFVIYILQAISLIIIILLLLSFSVYSLFFCTLFEVGCAEWRCRTGVEGIIDLCIDYIIIIIILFVCSLERTATKTTPLKKVCSGQLLFIILTSSATIFTFCDHLPFLSPMLSDPYAGSGRRKDSPYKEKGAASCSLSHDDGEAGASSSLYTSAGSSSGPPTELLRSQWSPSRSSRPGPAAGTRTRTTKGSGAGAGGKQVLVDANAPRQPPALDPLYLLYTAAFREGERRAMEERGRRPRSSDRPTSSSPGPHGVLQPSCWSADTEEVAGHTPSSAARRRRLEAEAKQQQRYPAYAHRPTASMPPAGVAASSRDQRPPSRPQRGGGGGGGDRDAPPRAAPRLAVSEDPSAYRQAVPSLPDRTAAGASPATPHPPPRTSAATAEAQQHNNSSSSEQRRQESQEPKKSKSVSINNNIELLDANDQRLVTYRPPPGPDELASYHLPMSFRSRSSRQRALLRKSPPMTHPQEDAARRRSPMHRSRSRDALSTSSRSPTSPSPYLAQEEEEQVERDRREREANAKPNAPRRRPDKVAPVVRSDNEATLRLHRDDDRERTAAEHASRRSPRARPSTEEEGLGNRDVSSPLPRPPTTPLPSSARRRAQPRPVVAPSNQVQPAPPAGDGAMHNPSGIRPLQPHRYPYGPEEECPEDRDRRGEGEEERTAGPRPMEKERVGAPPHDTSGTRDAAPQGPNAPRGGRRRRPPSQQHKRNQLLVQRMPSGEESDAAADDVPAVALHSCCVPTGPSTSTTAPRPERETCSPVDEKKPNGTRRKRSEGSKDIAAAAAAAAAEAAALAATALASVASRTPSPPSSRTGSPPNGRLAPSETKPTGEQQQQKKTKKMISEGDGSSTSSSRSSRSSRRPSAGQSLPRLPVDHHWAAARAHLQEVLRQLGDDAGPDTAARLEELTELPRVWEPSLLSGTLAPANLEEEEEEMEAKRRRKEARRLRKQQRQEARERLGGGPTRNGIEKDTNDAEAVRNARLSGSAMPIPPQDPQQQRRDPGSDPLLPVMPQQLQGGPGPSSPYAVPHPVDEPPSHRSSADSRGPSVLHAAASGLHDPAQVPLLPLLQTVACLLAPRAAPSDSTSDSDIEEAQRRQQLVTALLAEIQHEASRGPWSSGKKGRPSPPRHCHPSQSQRFSQPSTASLERGVVVEVGGGGRSYFPPSELQHSPVVHTPHGSMRLGQERKGTPLSPSPTVPSPGAGGPSTGFLQGGERPAQRRLRRRAMPHRHPQVHARKYSANSSSSSEASGRDTDSLTTPNSASASIPLPGEGSLFTRNGRSRSPSRSREGGSPAKPCAGSAALKVDSVPLLAFEEDDSDLIAPPPAPPAAAGVTPSSSSDGPQQGLRNSAGGLSPPPSAAFALGAGHPNHTRVRLPPQPSARSEADSSTAAVAAAREQQQLQIQQRAYEAEICALKRELDALRSAAAEQERRSRSRSRSRQPPAAAAWEVPPPPPSGATPRGSASAAEEEELPISMYETALEQMRSTLMDREREVIALQELLMDERRAAAEREKQQRAADKKKQKEEAPPGPDHHCTTKADAPQQPAQRRASDSLFPVKRKQQRQRPRSSQDGARSTPPRPEEEPHGAPVDDDDAGAHHWGTRTDQRRRPAPGSQRPFPRPRPQPVQQEHLPANGRAPPATDTRTAHTPVVLHAPPSGPATTAAAKDFTPPPPLKPCTARLSDSIDRDEMERVLEEKCANGGKTPPTTAAETGPTRTEEEEWIEDHLGVSPCLPQLSSSGERHRCNTGASSATVNPTPPYTAKASAGRSSGTGYMAKPPPEREPSVWDRAPKKTPAEQGMEREMLHRYQELTAAFYQEPSYIYIYIYIYILQPNPRRKHTHQKQPISTANRNTPPPPPPFFFFFPPPFLMDNEFRDVIYTGKAHHRRTVRDDHISPPFTLVLSPYHSYRTNRNRELTFFSYVLHSAYCSIGISINKQTKKTTNNIKPYERCSLHSYHDLLITHHSSLRSVVDVCHPSNLLSTNTLFTSICIDHFIPRANDKNAERETIASSAARRVTQRIYLVSETNKRKEEKTPTSFAGRKPTARERESLIMDSGSFRLGAPPNGAAVINSPGLTTAASTYRTTASLGSAVAGVAAGPSTTSGSPLAGTARGRRSSIVGASSTTVSAFTTTTTTAARAVTSGVAPIYMKFLKEARRKIEKLNDQSALTLHVRYVVLGAITDLARVNSLRPPTPVPVTAASVSTSTGAVPPPAPTAAAAGKLPPAGLAPAPLSHNITHPSVGSSHRPQPEGSGVGTSTTVHASVGGSGAAAVVPHVDDGLVALPVPLARRSSSSGAGESAPRTSGGVNGSCHGRTNSNPLSLGGGGAPAALAINAFLSSVQQLSQSPRLEPSQDSSGQFAAAEDEEATGGRHPQAPRPTGPASVAHPLRPAPPASPPLPAAAETSRSSGALQGSSTPPTSHAVCTLGSTGLRLSNTSGAGGSVPEMGSGRDDVTGAIGDGRTPRVLGGASALQLPPRSSLEEPANSTGGLSLHPTSSPRRPARVVDAAEIHVGVPAPTACSPPASLENSASIRTTPSGRAEEEAGAPPTRKSPAPAPAFSAREDMEGWDLTGSFTRRRAVQRLHAEEAVDPVVGASTLPPGCPGLHAIASSPASASAEEGSARAGSVLCSPLFTGQPTPAGPRSRGSPRHSPSPCGGAGTHRPPVPGGAPRRSCSGASLTGPGEDGVGVGRCSTAESGGRATAGMGPGSPTASARSSVSHSEMPSGRTRGGGGGQHADSHEDNSNAVLERLLSKLWSAILSAFFWQQRKLMDLAMMALEQLYRDTTVESRCGTVTLMAGSLAALRPSSPTAAARRSCSPAGVRSESVPAAEIGRDRGGIVVEADGRVTCTVHCGIYLALSAVLPLVTSGNTLDQTLLLLKDMLSTPISAASCVSLALTRVVRCCSSTAVESSSEKTRRTAEQVLRLCMEHASDHFLLSATPTPSPLTFRCRTALQNYVDDVENDCPYTWIEILSAEEDERIEEDANYYPLQRSPPRLNTTTTNNNNNNNTPGAAASSSSDTDSQDSSTRSDRDADETPLGKGERGSKSKTVASICSGGRLPMSPSQRGLTEGRKEGKPASIKGGMLDAAYVSGSAGLPSTGHPGPSTPMNLQQGASPNGRNGFRFPKPRPPREVQRSYNPQHAIKNSLDDTLMKQVESVMEQHGGLPPALREYVFCLRQCCRSAAGSRAAASTSKKKPSAEVEEKDLRERTLGMRLLTMVMERLPCANCEYEHPCATWLSVVLMACRYDLIGCIARNILKPEPFHLFKDSLQVLGSLLRKCHYPLARELHTLLAMYVLPITASPCSSFRQKHAVLSMVHEILSLPHVAVSYFINYDCNPSFDPNGEYRGMLELLVTFVTEMTFSDQTKADDTEGPQRSPKTSEKRCQRAPSEGRLDVPRGSLTMEQQKILRHECLMVIQTLSESMFYWATEDPKEIAKEIMGGNGGPLAVLADSEWVMMHLDLPSEAEDGEARPAPIPSPEVGPVSPTGPVVMEPLSRLELAGSRSLPRQHPYAEQLNYASYILRSQGLAGGTGSASQSISSLTSFLPPNSAEGSSHLNPVLPNAGCIIRYHWKHIHHLRHNKAIAVAASRMIAEGRWREAKTFLEDRSYIPRLVPSTEELNGGHVPPGRSSYAHFTRFLFDYPHMDRQAIQNIFEKVNKSDPAPRHIAREYFHLFDYRDKAIDVAFRDTTCRFVSWDRPMFEAQVWETLQQMFGEEFAAQNPRGYGATDAETLAGALLFLHSTLHNANAKGSEMTEEDFVQSTLECLEFPMDAKEVRLMYRRVAKMQWVLDAYGRTPQEAERASVCEQFSTRVWRQREARFAREAHHHQMLERKEAQRRKRAEGGGDEKGNAPQSAAHAADSPVNNNATEDASVASPNREPKRRAGGKSQLTVDTLSGSMHQRPGLTGTGTGTARNATGTNPQNLLPTDLATTTSTAGFDADTFTDDGGHSVVEEEDLNLTATSATTRLAHRAAARRGGSGGEGDKGGAGGSDQQVGGVGGSSGAGAPSVRDLAFLDPTIPSYTQGVDLPNTPKTLAKLKKEGNSFYVVAAEHLTKLEALHQLFFMSRQEYCPQPYILPHYAEHIRPMLLTVAPSMIACLYLGLRLAEEAPVYHAILHSYQRLYDIAAMFVMKGDQLDVAVEATLQRYLAGDESYELPAPCRAGFSLHMLAIP
eukprot:gene1521-906_t